MDKSAGWQATFDNLTWISVWPLLKTILFNMHYCALGPHNWAVVIRQHILSQFICVKKVNLKPLGKHFENLLLPVHYCRNMLCFFTVMVLIKKQIRRWLCKGMQHLLENATLIVKSKRDEWQVQQRTNVSSKIRRAVLMASKKFQLHTFVCRSFVQTDLCHTYFSKNTKVQKCSTWIWTSKLRNFPFGNTLHSCNCIVAVLV